jgi:hypothetical protein
MTPETLAVLQGVEERNRINRFAICVASGL